MDQYIVASGENLTKIARKLESSGKIPFREKEIQELIQLNQLKDPNELFEGQCLLLPDINKQLFPTCQTNKKTYIVRYGNSLCDIAEAFLGSPRRWHEIADLNNLESENEIFVGQELQLPHSAKTSVIPRQEKPSRFKQLNQARHVLARSFTFILADEILPSGKVVRKVIFPENIQGNPELIQTIINPEKYGIHPRDSSAKTSMGRHVLGITDSKYISASEHPMGSPRFSGKRYWINKEKVLKSGAKIHEASTIAQDLERIKTKTKDPKFLKFIDNISFKSRCLDKEVLIEGSIPAKAVKGALSKGITHGLQFVTVVGIVLSVYDLSLAAKDSIEHETIKPLAAETMRQSGGWGGALLGFEVGASLGAMVGISTGPGAVLTAAAGAMIFGAAGFLGANWVADFLDNSKENEVHE